MNRNLGITFPGSERMPQPHTISSALLVLSLGAATSSPSPIGLKVDLYGLCPSSAISTRSSRFASRPVAIVDTRLATRFTNPVALSIDSVGET